MTGQLRQRSFAVRYFTLFGGETFSKLCVMAAFAYLAHTLPAADYGMIEWALGVTVFFVLGVESGMGLYGARVIAAQPERLPTLVPQVMLLRALLGLPAFAIILAIAFGYGMAGSGLLAVNGLAILLTPFLTQWVFQGLRQMQWVAAGTAIRNFTFVALVLLFVTPGSDLRLVAVAEVSGIAMLALFSMFILNARLRASLEWKGAVAGTRRLFADVWFMGLSDFTWACLWYAPTLIVRWLGLGLEQVAWVAASVRIVLALHTFVFLYFFNLLPNLAVELVKGKDEWRALVSRSLMIAMWPAFLCALGGTLIAPLLIPLIFGPTYEAAVRPFQIVIWMIPVAWFSGHFRFSLIAAGQQRWEFAASAGAAAVVVAVALGLGQAYGSVGAALALLAGGVVNAILAVLASDRHITDLPFLRALTPVLAATAVSLGIGWAVMAAAGPLAGAVAGCLLFVAAAIRQHPEIVRVLREFMVRP